MIQQTIRERHRKNKRITGLEPKPQQLAMLKFTIAQNGATQTHPAQIAMRKNTAREIKIGEVGRSKIDMRKNAFFVFPRSKRMLKSENVYELLIVLINRHDSALYIHIPRQSHPAHMKLTHVNFHQQDKQTDEYRTKN